MKSWFALKIIYPTIKLFSKKKLPNPSHFRKMAYPTHFSSVPTPGINNEHSLRLTDLQTSREVVVKGVVKPISAYVCLFPVVVTSLEQVVIILLRFPYTQENKHGIGPDRKIIDHSPIRQTFELIKFISTVGKSIINLVKL